MITELSKEQQARFPEFVEKWTKIGLCTDPADRDQAEEGVRLSYRIVGIEPPEKIVWCESPLAVARSRHIARIPTPSVRDSVLSVVESVQNWVSSTVADSIAKSVMKSVANSVWDTTWAVWSSDLSRDEVDVSFGGSITGQHVTPWCAYCDYFRVACGLTEQTEKMLGLMQVAENSGWWAPYKDVCWISERPNRLKFDDRWTLHSEDGPALAYADGFSIYAIHGVRVDEQVVMSPTVQDVDVIRNESNAEVKRIRIERYGWAEYLRAVGAVVLDTRDNDVEATKEALMRTPDDQVVLVCSCPSTARVYSLEVPPGIMTCEAAQDWLSGGLSARVINGA